MLVPHTLAPKVDMHTYLRKYESKLKNMLVANIEADTIWQKSSVSGIQIPINENLH